VAPAAHQNNRPRHPRAKLRFARGAQHRASKTPPLPRASRPLGRGSASLEGRAPPRLRPASLEGQSPPRVRFRLARGLDAPSGEVRLTRGSRGHTAPIPAHPTEPFNALTHAGTRRPSDAPGNHTPALFRQLPSAPSPPLCDAVRQGRCQSRDTVPPTLVRLMRRALERGRRNPQKGTDVHSTLARDYAVTSGRRGPSPPSPSVLYTHPRHHNTISSTAAPSPTLWGYGATRHHHVVSYAPYGLPSVAPSSQRADDDSTGDFNTTTLEATLGRAQSMPGRSTGSQIRQDSCLLHGIVRHATTRR
jgi:hypothetical protein